MDRVLQQFPRQARGRAGRAVRHQCRANKEQSRDRWVGRRRLRRVRRSGGESPPDEGRRRLRVGERHGRVGWTPTPSKDHRGYAFRTDFLSSACPDRRWSAAQLWRRSRAERASGVAHCGGLKKGNPCRLTREISTSSTSGPGSARRRRARTSSPPTSFEGSGRPSISRRLRQGPATLRRVCFTFAWRNRRRPPLCSAQTDISRAAGFCPPSCFRGACGPAA